MPDKKKYMCVEGHEIGVGTTGLFAWRCECGTIFCSTCVLRHREATKHTYRHVDDPDPDREIEKWLRDHA